MLEGRRISAEGTPRSGELARKLCPTVEDGKELGSEKLWPALGEGRSSRSVGEDVSEEAGGGRFIKVTRERGDPGTSKISMALVWLSSGVAALNATTGPIPPLLTVERFTGGEGVDTTSSRTGDHINDGRRSSSTSCAVT